jgi:hypothetical protein
MRRYIGLGFIIIALILIFASFLSPWWSQTRKPTEEDYQMSESYGLTSYYQTSEVTNDQYQYNCPECGDYFASDEEDLEDEDKDWVCPNCNNYIGDSYDDLDDLRRYCPECGNYVGRNGDSCWDCGATFNEPAIWCDDCDEEITPVKKYRCWDCDAIFEEPDKEKEAAEGDRYDVSVPYSNYQLAEPKKEMGVENKINVCKITMYLLIISLVFTVLAIITFLLVIRRKGRLRGRVAVPIVFTLLLFILILITPLYFAVAWPGALEDDFDDSTSELSDSNGNYNGYYNDEPSSSSEPEQIVTGFMGSKYSEEHSFDFTGSYGYSSGKTKYTWGPTIGWYLALIAMVFVILAFISIIATRRRIRGYMYGRAPPDYRYRAWSPDQRVPQQQRSMPTTPTTPSQPKQQGYEQKPPQPRIDYSRRQTPPPPPEPDYTFAPPSTTKPDYSYPPPPPPPPAQVPQYPVADYPTKAPGYGEKYQQGYQTDNSARNGYDFSTISQQKPPARDRSDLRYQY